MNYKSMIKKLLLIMSLFSIVEGSFRTQEEHEESIGAATNVPGCGATVIILTERAGGQTNIVNGTYIAPGKVLTHSHEKMIPAKTWVISTFLTQELSYTVGFSNGYINFFQADVNEQLKLNRHSCRRVLNIAYPASRQEVAKEDVRRVLDMNTIPGSLPFVEDHERYISEVAEMPIIGEEFSVAGNDYCIMEIEPFSDHHPIATISTAPITEEIIVKVLGHSLLTKKHDGRNYRLPVEIQKACAGMEITSLPMKIRLPLGATYFSQVARPIGNKFVVEAVCASVKNALQGATQDEIWDPVRTDARIQAMIVDGLGGSGVYNENNELIGIVSCAQKCVLTKTIEDCFDQAMQSKNQLIARKLLPCLPQKLEHPLLNIHQAITPEIYELLH